MDWGAEYKLGVERFDNHHRQIAGVIGRMEDMARQGGDPAAWSALLDEMISISLAHFTEEEAELAKKDYPELLEHQDEHRNLLNELFELAGRQKETGSGPSLEVAEFLANWMAVHVAETDMRYRGLFGE
ncbi:MAG: bacteriohemerythrin [Nitrospinota bacterium]|nr:bacteriohemerythrin [Nitrospinota bacterium]